LTNKNKKLLICDFDGTLIDSSDGILKAIELACGDCGVKPVVPLEKTIIGPPLEETLQHVTRISNSSELSELKKVFIRIYDSGICNLATPFPGVDQMLRTVISEGHELALATNKRKNPVIQILQEQDWLKYFSRIETVDSVPDHRQTKAEMLIRILSQSADSRSAFYLGDTEWDVLAAAEAGVPCWIAAWGYGEKHPHSNMKVLESPEEIVRLLKSN
jgi:phosphoglycolate phosphatase